MSEGTGRRTRNLPGKERVQLKVNCRDRQPSSGWQPQDSLSKSERGGV